MRGIDRYLRHLEDGTLSEYYEAKERPSRKLKKYTKGKTRMKGQSRFIGKS